MKQEVFPIVFLGTDDFSLRCLNLLVERPEFEVKAVITQATRPKGRGLQATPSSLTQRVKELSLPLWTPDDLKAPEFLSQVKALDVDWAVLLSYGKILPEVFLSLFPDRALNFHASLLPQWRGAAPVQRAIMAGDTELGMSLQVMEPKLDRGPLVGVRSFEMSREMDAKDAFKEMESLMKMLLTDLLEYMKGSRIPVKQDEKRKVMYARKIDKKESKIEWKEPAIKIWNKIRALVTGPQAYTLYKGKRVKIYKAKCDFKSTSAPPGQIVNLGSDSFEVACGDCVLSIIQLQPESKKIMSAEEYMRGYNLQTGFYLGV